MKKINNSINKWFISLDIFVIFLVGGSNVGILNGSELFPTIVFA
jgi:hypothetical protein